VFKTGEVWAKIAEDSRVKRDPRKSNDTIIFRIPPVGGVTGAAWLAAGGRSYRRQLPLSDAEFREIEGNVAPYMAR
jgi:hypothetical protein